MPTTIYKDPVTGRRLRSVTAIKGHYGNKDGMIYAANKIGLEGKSHRDEWNKAGRLGTLVHEVVTGALLAGAEDRLEETDRLVEQVEQDVPRDLLDWFASCIAGWYRLLDDMILGPCLCAEEHLISEKHGYGGTPDAAIIQGAAAVADIKTGSVYPDVIMQLAAYRQLLVERDETKDVAEGYIIQLNRDGGGYRLHHYPSEVLDVGWGWFRSVKTALEAEDIAKAMCR